MIILYTSLIFSCVWLGVLQAKKLSTRQTFYENMLGFLRAFHTNLSFVQKGYMEVAEEYMSSGVSVEFAKFLSSKLAREKYNPDFLTLRENKELEDVILSLGKHDEETEKTMTEDAISLVKTRLEVATRKSQKYSSFSIKLSLLVGVLLVILLL